MNRDAAACRPPRAALHLRPRIRLGVASPARIGLDWRQLRRHDGHHHMIY